MVKYASKSSNICGNKEGGTMNFIDIEKAPSKDYLTEVSYALLGA
jgi:hypothetical protein